MSCAVRKTTHAAALTTSAVMITGSRPRQSDTDPKDSSVASRTRTYTANTAVSVAAEK